MPRDDHITVWSSEKGDLRRPVTKSVIPKTQSLPPQQQTAYLHRETKGRGGKTVTLVKNLVLSENDYKTLLKTIKQTCGSGGTLKEGVIEIQGDHREKIAELLRKLGYKAKLAGG